MREIKRGYRWLVHIILWIIIFSMPFFSPRPGRSLQGEGFNYIHFIPVALSFMTVFYVNYFFLIKKYVKTGRIWAFVLLNILLIVACSEAVSLSYRLLFPMPEMGPRRARPFIATVFFTLRNSLVYCAFIGAAIAVRMTSEWYRNEAEIREMEKAKAEAELASLKSQVNPHFLFNTLNNIYSLIQINPDVAQGAVHDLSGMMRYVLYDSNDNLVPLSKEVTFLQDYIELMRLRLAPNISLDVELPENPSNRKIAPLLFIPLVENAFKHGIDDTEASSIRICLEENADNVTLRTGNTSFPKSDGDRSGSGIGIANLEKRLEMLYPGKYTYKYGPVGDRYESLLRIDTNAV
ncbi:MAG: histidine kinase [Bacteroidales bacterium]|nr:histidine kinase [Bacteroidales bacterium]